MKYLEPIDMMEWIHQTQEDISQHDVYYWQPGDYRKYLKYCKLTGLPVLYDVKRIYLNGEDDEPQHDLSSNDGADSGSDSSHGQQQSSQRTGVAPSSGNQSSIFD